MSDWESIKREARRIEVSLEDKVQAYSRLAARITGGGADARGGALYDIEDPADNMAELGLARDIDHLLTQLQECVDAMSTVVSQNGRATAGAQLQRYREILFDNRTEYNKAAAAINRHRDASELFRGRKAARHKSSGADGDQEQLLRESQYIQSSLRGASGVLGQAHEARQALRTQRETLDRTSALLTQLGNAFPGIGKIVDSIGRRRSRDTAIVATVLAGCICFSLWWMLG